MDAPHEIWLQSAQWSKRRRCLKMLTDDRLYRRQTTTTEARHTISSRSEPSAQVSWKGKRKVQGVPQSQAAANPRHQEEEKREKAQIKQTYEKPEDQWSSSSPETICSEPLHRWLTARLQHEPTAECPIITLWVHLSVCQSAHLRSVSLCRKIWPFRKKVKVNQRL